LLAAGITLAASLSTQAAVVTFDELDPGPQGYWNGTPPAEEFATADTTFSSGGATFSNSVTNWGGGFSSWSGFVYSSLGDTTTPGFENQYSAYAGGGLGASGNFAVGYGSSTPGEEGPALTLSTLTNMAGLGAFFTNTTYAALAMRDGYYSADKFGGEDGTAPDYLMLTIHGYNGSTETGTVNFYLADFRFADSGQDYIVDAWTWVDLSDLGTVNKLTFSFQSSDIGDYGIDTPTYFAMDNLVIPEPSTALTSLAGLALLARRRRR
jgi:hypothetical protein